MALMFRSLWLWWIIQACCFLKKYQSLTGQPVFKLSLTQLLHQPLIQTDVVTSSRLILGLTMITHRVGLRLWLWVKAKKEPFFPPQSRPALVKFSISSLVFDWKQQWWKLPEWVCGASDLMTILNLWVRVSPSWTHDSDAAIQSSLTL